MGTGGPPCLRPIDRTERWWGLQWPVARCPLHRRALSCRAHWRQLPRFHGWTLSHKFRAARLRGTVREHITIGNDRRALRAQSFLVLEHCGNAGWRSPVCGVVTIDLALRWCRHHEILDRVSVCLVADLVGFFGSVDAGPVCRGV